MSAVGEKSYWYYSNGAYELESVFYSNGQRELENRHIKGPIPSKDLWSIVNTPARLDPQQDSWQDEIIKRLAAARFNTKMILEGKPKECEMTTTSYVLSYLTWRNFSAAALAVATGYYVMTSDKPAIVGEKIWQVSSVVGGYLPTLPNIKSVSSPLSKVLQPVLGPGIVTATFLVLDKTILALGPDGYEAWKDKMLKVYIENQESFIPERFHQDPVLSQNICPISSRPIRVPCRSAAGLFEEKMIKAWLSQQIESDQEPIYPGSNRPLVSEELTIDYELSDKIELRLLLLKALEQ